MFGYNYGAGTGDGDLEDTMEGHDDEIDNVALELIIHATLTGKALGMAFPPERILGIIDEALTDAPCREILLERVRSYL